MGNVWETNFEDSEHLVSGFPRFESGRIEETRSVTMVKIYQITAAEYLPLLMHLPKKGRVHLIDCDGIWCWFQIESVQLERFGKMMPSAISGAETMRRNCFFVKAVLKMSLLKLNADPSVPPWLLPAYNFRAVPVPFETPVRSFYPASGDPLFSGAGTAVSLIPMPFVNTAGQPLTATGTRILTRFQFSYNIESGSAEAAAASELLWLWPGRCNSAPVRFAGIDFPPLSLRFDSFSYLSCEQDYRYSSLIGGESVEISGTYRFLKCNVTLTADPLTFVRNWLNAGEHIRKNGGIERIWGWTDSEGKSVFGSYVDALKHKDAQTAGLLFLNAAGDNVSSFGTDGRQTPVYRRGVLLQPFDFNLLGLPTELPEGCG